MTVYLHRRTLVTTIGCALAATWSVFCMVTLNSTVLATLPQLAIFGLLLYALTAHIYKQIQPHQSYAIKLQEALLKDNIEVERKLRQGINDQRTYFCSLDSDDLVRDRPECIMP